MSVSLTITGVEQLVAALRQVGDRVLPVAGGALFQEAETIMADSKEHYVPVDTGTLRDSGHVEPPTMDGQQVTVQLGYGGAAKDYAIVQHERLDYVHSVGGPKYLEWPLLAAAPKLAANLAARIRALFGG